MGIPAARVIGAVFAAAGGDVKEVSEGMERGWGQGSAADWLRVPGRMTWRRTYSGRADQVPVARQFAVSLFTGTGHEETVGFIVTELASNAVRHTLSGAHRGWFGLELVCDELAYIAVTDQGGSLRPIVIPESLGDHQPESGRGLRAVTKLATAIGIHGDPDGGHTVWADLDLRSDFTSGPGWVVPLAS